MTRCDPSHGTGQNAKTTNVYSPWDGVTGLEGGGGGWWGDIRHVPRRSEARLLVGGSRPSREISAFDPGKLIFGHLWSRSVTFGHIHHFHSHFEITLGFGAEKCAWACLSKKQFLVACGSLG